MKYAVYLIACRFKNPLPTPRQATRTRITETGKQTARKITTHSFTMLVYSLEMHNLEQCGYAMPLVEIK